jgi:mRNA-degrading endonuclease RelE of RelBE toxin-antitoxin system
LDPEELLDRATGAAELGGFDAEAFLDGLLADCPRPAARAEVDAVFGPPGIVLSVLFAGRKARDQIACLAKKDRRDVLKVVERLKKDPVEMVLRQMRPTFLFSAPYGDLYRLRAGRVRLIVVVDKDKQGVSIQGVGLRPPT